jgi:DNA-binding transcriptional ArsR family regulator
MKEVAQFFKVVADEARLKIIWLLFHHDELCVCAIGVCLTLRWWAARKRSAWTPFARCAMSCDGGSLTSSRRSHEISR